MQWESIIICSTCEVYQLTYSTMVLMLLVIGDNEARPQYLQWADLRCVGHVCSLMSVAGILPTSACRPPCFVLRKGPSMPKTELKHTERGAQHCNNGRPTPVYDPYRPSLKYNVTHSSSMKGPRLNFHAGR